MGRLSITWFFGLATAGGLGATSLAAPPTTRLAGPPSRQTGVADLADRLKSGLRVQAPQDVAFCDAVAESVRSGALPERIVDATLVWAVQRGKKYPFPAFQHAIRLKAERLGVRL